MGQHQNGTGRKVFVLDAMFLYCNAQALGSSLPFRVSADRTQAKQQNRLWANKNHVQDHIDGGACMNKYSEFTDTSAGVALMMDVDTCLLEAPDSYLKKAASLILYIQYQMEQVAADRAEQGAGLTSFSDNRQCGEKLVGAVQAWEWSPRHMDFLKNNLLETLPTRTCYSLGP